jgi:hypothetical protein
MFGMPVEQLSGVLTERELRAWMSRDKPLPQRRTEKMLAQIAAMLAWTNGNKGFKFEDADLYRPGRSGVEEEEEPEDDGTAKAAGKVFANAAGSRVHVIKVKKKGGADGG